VGNALILVLPQESGNRNPILDVSISPSQAGTVGKFGISEAGISFPYG